jgi:hypothetical protein
MKRLLAFSIIALMIGFSSVLPFVFLINSVGASSAMWSQTYGVSAETERAYALVETHDGGFAMAGYAVSNETHEADFCLVKTDANGNMQWRKTYGGARNYTWGVIEGGLQWEVAYALVETSDGGFAMAGYAVSNQTFGSDFWLVKTDANGNMQWNRTYGGTADDQASALIETSDGGYAIVGKTFSFGAGNIDFWLVKTDSYGNMEWNKTYGGISHDHASALMEISDGGFALAGWTWAFANCTDFWLIKTDSTGVMEWNKTYGGEDYDRAFSFVKAPDGGYVLAGYTESFGAGKLDLWLVKTDADGNMEWNRTYGRGYNDHAHSVVATSDGGYAVAGYTVSSETSDDFWLIKTDEYGIMQWNQTYGGTVHERAYALVEASDGGYALAGDTSSSGNRGIVFWLVKTDEYGIVPEFPSWALLPLFLSTTMAFMIYKKRLKQKMLR